MLWEKNFKVEDENHNILSFLATGIYLKLKSETKKRCIGSIEKTKNGVLYYKKTNLKENIHIMRKNDSWGLHRDVIYELPEKSFILIESDRKRYCIKVEKAKKYGETLWFKKQGFERQIFVPRKYWTTEDL